MEIMIGFFWIIKLIWWVLLISVLYYAYKLKSKFLIGLSIVVIILGVVSPIKLKPDMQAVTLQEEKIENNKVLPEKVEDNTFKDKTKIIGITKEDLK